MDDRSPMDEFDLEIKREFINEALMNLEETEGSFMELESSADPKTLLDKIFRLAHNLKGGSRAVGFGDIAEFTHELENLVQKIRRDEILLNPQIVTTLLRSNDRLVEMLSELKGNMEAKFNNADLIADIVGWMNGSNSTTASASEHVPASTESTEVIAEVESFVDLPADSEASMAVVHDNISSPETVLSEEVPTVSDYDPFAEAPPVMPSAEAFFGSSAQAAPAASATPVPMPAPGATSTPAPTPTPAPAKLANSGGGSSSPKQLKDDEIIRVSLSKIDLLNDYVGELIVLQSVIQQQTADNNPAQLLSSVRQMTKLAKDIQSLSMSLRMLPVKPLVQKLQRVVRDTAQALKKDVNLEIIGEQMEIDKSVLDNLSDPLIHILRNAVDHGLEDTNDRVSSGKSKQGHVTLSFNNDGNHLVVEVKDDGKGINGEVLRKKAIEKKIISEMQQLSEKQLVNLIFHPGFSTKAVTSEISGRGVGMDVVKTNVEKIGGNIDITTTVGSGSLFKLQIPLTLAVIDGLIVVSESQRYVVPLNQVQETLNLKTQKVFTDKTGIGSCLDLRGAVVPLVHIDDALGIKKNAKINENDTALIVNVQDRSMALIIKDIVRAQQIVVKPFTNGIISQRGWVGSCVLGDGMPTLIISPTDLLKGKIKENNNENVLRGAA